jgi:hypothetical protein
MSKASLEFRPPPAANGVARRDRGGYSLPDNEDKAFPVKSQSKRLRFFWFDPCRHDDFLGGLAAQPRLASSILSSASHLSLEKQAALHPVGAN